MRSRIHHRLFAATAALIATIGLATAQGTVVIPAGYDVLDGTSSSAFPFNDANSHIWQWHYDSSEFLAAGINFPISITDVAVRAATATATVNAFSFPSVEIELIEASTDWANGNHSTTFAANILSSAIVRTAAPWVGGPVPPSGGTTATFFSIGFDPGASFTYDPTTGNDFIIQIRKCGSTTTWGQAIDGAANAMATRYGVQTSCTATVSTFSNPAFCPIAQLSWQPVVLAPDDIQVVSVDAPSTGADPCTPLSPAEPVTCTLRNAGSNVIPMGTSIPISFTTDGGMSVTSESFVPAANMNPGDTASFTFVSGAFLFIPGIYTVTVTTAWGLDPNAANDSKSKVVESLSGATISSYPWVENFDGFGAVNGGTAVPPGWTNDPTDAGGSATNGDWFARTASLPTTTTGPTADHTTGVPNAGFYFQVEDAGSFASVNLLTPCLDLASLTNPFMTFWLHSKNATVPPTNLMNTISVDVLTYPGGVPVLDVFGPIGHVGNDWSIQGGSLAAFAGQKIQIRFRGRSDAGGSVHDLCIDDVTVFNGVQGTGQAPQPGLAVLDINNSTDGFGLPVASGNNGIFSTTVAAGATVNMSIDGAALQPIVMLYGPANAGIVGFPGIGQFDIGTTIGPFGVPNGIALLADGTQANFFDVLFRTTASGNAVFSFPMPVMPPGYVTTFQALLFTGGPTVVAMSNAVNLNTM